MPSTTPFTHPMPQASDSSQPAYQRSAFHLPKANSKFNRKPTGSGLIPALTPGNRFLKLTPTTCTRSLFSYSQLSLSQLNQWLIYPFSTLIQPVLTHTTLNPLISPLRPPLCDLPTDDSPCQRQSRYQPTPYVERTSGTSLFLWKKPCPGLICPDLWGVWTAQCSSALLRQSASCPRAPYSGPLSAPLGDRVLTELPRPASTVRQGRTHTEEKGGYRHHHSIIFQWTPGQPNLNLSFLKT